jgi:pyruvate formate lyase activating enzyme
MEVCGQKTITISRERGYPVDPKKCRACGQCAGACKFRALRFAGNSYTTGELCKKLLKDRVFYKNSGGGVTFSGGEPTANPDYLSELAAKLKEHEIHLCLETSGFYNRDIFEQKLLPCLDLVYFDIKILDRETHKKYCGVYNDVILDNFSALFSSGKVKVLPRIPLVPGITAVRENLIAIRSFFQKCGVREIGLLPYNPLWLSKLSGIGAKAEYSRSEWMESGEKNEIKDIFRDFSFRDF